MELFVAVLTSAVVFFAFLYAWINEWKTVRVDEAQREEALHHCVRCSTMYLAPARSGETAACPQCGHKNIPLKF